MGRTDQEKTSKLKDIEAGPWKDLKWKTGVQPIKHLLEAQLSL